MVLRSHKAICRATFTRRLHDVYVGVQSFIKCMNFAGKANICMAANSIVNTNMPIHFTVYIAYF
jgi:hypothetical protein